MKNVLKEIKNDIISKGDEPRVDNIEQLYISKQNILFIILFKLNPRIFKYIIFIENH